MNQKGFSPLFIFLGIILVLGIVGGVYYVFTNNSQKEEFGKAQLAPTAATITNSKAYTQSTILKNLVSEKFKFKVSYPDKWSYYPEQQYIETSFILIPEFNGTIVEIDVIKNSDYYTEGKLDTEPLAHKSVLQEGYATGSFTSSSGLEAKTFEGNASSDYLSNNNLKGDYKVKITQYRGQDYTYVITTTYFVGSGTDLFLSDLNKLLLSFILNN